MTAYVFGAGASRTGGYPLASELGGLLIEWARQSHETSNLYGAGIRQLFELYGDLHNLEQILTELDECPAGSRVASLSRAQRGLAKVHVRLGISEIFRTLRQKPAPFYERLARERLRHDDVIITFNYDLACERELKNAGLWEIGNGYGFDLECVALPPAQVSVLKLHGSVNWFEVPFGGNTGFFQAPQNPLGLRPVIPAWEFEFFGYSHDLRDPEAPVRPFGAFPAMIMPSLSKRFYAETSMGRELESFWDSLWDRASRALRRSKKVVIIGYSMGVADERAKHLLLNVPNRDAEIEIFCGDRTEWISEEFKSHGYNRLRTFGNHLFEDYLATR